MGRFGDPYEKVLTFGTTLVDPGNKLRLTTAMIVLLSKKKKKIAKIELDPIRITTGVRDPKPQKVTSDRNLRRIKQSTLQGQRHI